MKAATVRARLRDKPYRRDEATDRDSTPDLVNRHLTVRLQPGEYFAEVRHRGGRSRQFHIRVVAVPTPAAKKERPLPPIDTSKKCGSWPC